LKLGAEPQLFVADIARSVRFFVDGLGFRTVFLYGDPPYYGQVERGGARLNLRCVEKPVIDPVMRDADELLSAALTVDTRAGLDALAAEFQLRGVPFFQDPRDEPWGARDFIVRDPDGNLLLFAGPVA
jgi:catechol 2,3-dioxygenase-like lactoylglutathione lyase family enzyme